MAHESGLVQTAVRQLWVQRGGGGGEGHGGDAGVVVTLSMKMEVVPSDTAPVTLQEAQLGVVQDVEVSAAQAVTRRTDEEVTVMFATLPPWGEVGGGAAQLEACRD